MNSEQHSGLVKALSSVMSAIRQAESDANREAGSVQLLAVSKTKPASMVKQAFKAGQRDFGENYLDEAVEKISTLQSLECCWHFIGAIQSNKTKPIAQHFSWVHGIDREKIARRLSAHRMESHPSEPLNCCIQLNVDDEASKAGVTEEQLPGLCTLISELPGLNLRGLMVIPAVRTDVDDQRQVFRHIKQLFDNCCKSNPSMDTLSMGMSGDMEAAIAEGSTMARVGTALFGRRD